jgi:hypothetical protein
MESSTGDQRARDKHVLHRMCILFAKPDFCLHSSGLQLRPAAQMELGTLFMAALLLVLKVAMLCSVGAGMAIQNVLTLKGRRVISGLIFNLFVPCIFLDKLGSGFGIQDAFALWYGVCTRAQYGPLTCMMYCMHADISIC